MKKKIYLKKLKKSLDNTDNYFDNEINEILNLADKCLIDKEIIILNKVKLYLSEFIEKLKFIFLTLKSKGGRDYGKKANYNN